VLGPTATLALAFLVVSAALVAVTVTLVLLVTEGAVNMPPLETLPEVADHITAVLLVPFTAALNCCVPPDVRAALPGETTTLTVVGAEGLTVTLALAFLVVSAALVAVTVTLVLLETAGAVNMPLQQTLPEVADHMTDVLLVPCTTALKCWVPPDVRTTLPGETTTLTVGDAEGLTVTIALALLVVSAALVAVTVTLVVLETLGAVKYPPSLILPAVTDQITDVELVPETIPVKC
jgi:hypothetical protein